MSEVKVFLVKYEDGGTKWKSGIGRKAANRLLCKLEADGMRPIIVTAVVDVEQLMDTASSLFVSRSSISRRGNSR